MPGHGCGRVSEPDISHFQVFVCSGSMSVLSMLSCCAWSSAYTAWSSHRITLEVGTYASKSNHYADMLVHLHLFAKLSTGSATLVQAMLCRVLSLHKIQGPSHSRGQLNSFLVG